MPEAEVVPGFYAMIGHGVATSATPSNEPVAAAIARNRFTVALLLRLAACQHSLRKHSTPDSLQNLPKSGVRCCARFDLT